MKMQENEFGVFKGFIYLNTKKREKFDNNQGLLYTGRARASLGLSSLGQFFRQCLGPHFLLWNLDFWYARSLGQNEKN